ncbi:MAG TPA: peptidase MA family metallohydrolase [Anaerolineales bacterium]|nr:peptidase MA family metallohydrolase [Anaerolineales bacterium]
MQRKNPPSLDLRLRLHIRILLLIAVLPILFNARPFDALALSLLQAESGIELENVGASVQFGEQIVFRATVKTSIPIREVSILILDESQGIIHDEPLEVQADGRTEFRYDIAENVLRPFTPVSWNYRFTLPDGSSTNSEVFSILYEDNRFNWQSVESGNLRINWYAGDSEFGQSAMKIVQSSVDSVSRLLPVDLEQPVEFYIYASIQDLRGTLLPGSQEWIAGHTDPSLGVVMVAIEPGPQRDIILQQRIPHELMHIMLYRAVGNGYRNIPSWFSEGMPGLAEMVPNTGYNRVLEEAIAREDWIPISHLCGSFPADTDRAFLAYAESQSFASYLHRTYGSPGLLNLARAYANGADCEQGLELAFGVPLSELELGWHESVLGPKAFFPALQNIIPYLGLLCLILIIPLIGILSAARGKGRSHGPETYIRK